MNIERISQFFQIDSNNPWKDTLLEDFYLLTPKIKGIKGEEIVLNILKGLGYKISPRINPEHDAIVNNKKTEIKFSLATNRNYDWQFTFNHIGLAKDWEQIIFAGINGNQEIKIVSYDKTSLPLNLLKKQQGGNHGKNDDYLCSGLNSTKLLNFGHIILK